MGKEWVRRWNGDEHMKGIGRGRKRKRKRVRMKVRKK
jgi:hypothetical protein